ncbi:MAG: MarR family transcriptional regulator [Methanosarcinaceae archaeon]|nr:MarR family transcriptional regulator [Methanosarcinaceae archaeon]
MAEEYPEQLFLQEKPSLALLTIGALGKTYASVITKEINSTFAHTTKILSKMEQYGLVKFTVEGRVKYVELSELGYDVVEALNNLIITLKGDVTHEETVPEDSQPDIAITTEIDSESRHIQDRIDKLSSKIETIYNDLSDSGTDSNTIARRLGPFSRDIKIIDNLIGSSPNTIESAVVNSLNDIRRRFEYLLNQ